MKILVTGHKGLLGSAFVKRYGHIFEIVGYDLKDGEDLFDYSTLLLKMEGCEQVVHLAAIPAPVEGKTFEDYFNVNDRATFNVVRAALARGVKRIVYGSSTTIYGVEKGIPFSTPIKENQPFVSQYISADRLSCRDVDLAYHASKVIAEQIIAWHGLMKKIQVVALRFGPINKVFLGTSVSINNATQAIKLALESEREFWYEAFSIVDEIEHVDISKAKKFLGYQPEETTYSKEQIDSGLDSKNI
jgi:nucleoside-diphosphate-sugar epimerase